MPVVPRGAGATARSGKRLFSVEFIRVTHEIHSLVRLEAVAAHPASTYSSGELGLSTRVFIREFASSSEKLRTSPSCRGAVSRNNENHLALASPLPFGPRPCGCSSKCRAKLAVQALRLFNILRVSPPRRHPRAIEATGTRQCARQPKKRKRRRVYNPPSVDPEGAPQGERRVRRGGYFYCDAVHERAAWRNRDLVEHSWRSIGFRIVAVPRAGGGGR